MCRESRTFSSLAPSSVYPQFGVPCFPTSPRHVSPCFRCTTSLRRDTVTAMLVRVLSRRVTKAAPAKRRSGVPRENMSTIATVEASRLMWLPIFPDFVVSSGRRGHVPGIAHVLQLRSLFGVPTVRCPLLSDKCTTCLSMLSLHDSAATRHTCQRRPS